MVRGLGIVVAALVLLLGCGQRWEGQVPPRSWHSPLPGGGQSGSPGPQQPGADRIVTGIAVGNPGDHWVDTMQYLRVARATRDGKRGYEVTYELPGELPGRGTTFTLFWSRDHIDLRGVLPSYRLRTRLYGNARVGFPTRLTEQSLPHVYRAIQEIEQGHAQSADGAIAAAGAFGVVAALGGLVPAPRAPGPATTAPARAPPTPAAGAIAPSSRALGRALEAAGHVKPPGWAAHHIVAGSAKHAEPARRVLQRFGIGINDAANGLFLPATRAVSNPTGAAVHSTLHTKAYYRVVNEVLLTARTRQEVLQYLQALGQRLLRGGI